MNKKNIYPIFFLSIITFIGVLTACFTEPKVVEVTRVVEVTPVSALQEVKEVTRIVEVKVTQVSRAPIKVITRLVVKPTEPKVEVTQVDESQIVIAEPSSTILPTEKAIEELPEISPTASSTPSPVIEISMNHNLYTYNNPIGESVNSFIIDPKTSTTLYIGTESSGMLKSTNSGESWIKINSGLSDKEIRALVIDPQNPSILYSGTSEKGVFKSENGGEEWSEANTNLSCPYIFALAIDPITPSKLYAGTLCGIFKSTDSGENWAKVSPDTMNPQIRALVIDPVNPSIIYAGTDSGPAEIGATPQLSGVFISTDEGTLWSEINTGLPEYAPIQTLAIHPSSPSTLYAGLIGREILYESVNGGSSWNAITEGLISYGNHVQHIEIDPIAPTTLYVGTSKYGIFRSIDGGKNWHMMNTGMTTNNVQVLGIDPSNPSTLYAGTSWDGAFKSTNGGHDWQNINVGLPIASVYALVMDTNPPETIYAGTSYGVYKSIDDGKHWSGINETLGYGHVTSLVIGSETPPTLFAGIRDYLYATDNEGETWGFYEPIDDNIRAILLDPVTPSTIYVGFSGGGVYKKVSEETWKPINKGLNNTIPSPITRE